MKTQEKTVLVVILSILIVLIALVIYFRDKIMNIISPPKEETVVNINEVYNISPNKYTYEDAGIVCEALGSKLATHDQVVEAYKKGAEWCNYGWTQGQNALFPIQKETWNKLQEGPPAFKDDCGQDYGVNGGFFENKYLRFGVNCYGKKPEGLMEPDYRISVYESRKAAERLKKLKAIKDSDKNIKLLPFNERRWSEFY